MDIAGQSGEENSRHTASAQKIGALFSVGPGRSGRAKQKRKWVLPWHAHTGILAGTPQTLHRNKFSVLRTVVCLHLGFP